MKDYNEDVIGRIVACVAMLFVCVLIFIGCEAINDSSWNNGHCSCGGDWVYQQAVGHDGYTTYMYKCDKCGKVNEFFKCR